MPTKKINLGYEGESALIDAAVDALAISNGFTQGTEEEKLASAAQLVTNFIRGVVSRYNVERAKAQIELIAQAEAIGALDAITKSFSVEEKRDPDPIIEAPLETIEEQVEEIAQEESVEPTESTETLDQGEEIP